ncbi:MAG: AAA family ATPase [Bdellovibrionales bacterium]|nr:AAA family ATPase [Bdellovibrionales bacterium]
MPKILAQKLVLVGDARQLQPVDAGGPFKAIASEVGEARLSRIRRQEEAWAREAVHKFASGEAKEGLKEFAERGQLSVSNTPKEAKAELLNDWAKAGVERPKENLILVGTNLDAKEINEKAQLKRFSAGKLGEDSASVGGERVFTGDRVLFTRNSRVYGVRNGQLGTVEKIDGNRLTTRLDNGERVSVSLTDYEHVKLGYAVTTHKSQGMTAQNTYILAGGPMQDREMSYVQVSRAKGKTRIYTDKVEAGDNLTALSRQMSKSRQKDLATDVLKQVKRQEMRILR